MYDYLKMSQELEDELIAEMGQEAYDASQHWINNPLIKPVSKMAMFEEWEGRIRKEQNERIIKLLEEEQRKCEQAGLFANDSSLRGELQTLFIGLNGAIELIKGEQK